MSESKPIDEFAGQGGSYAVDKPGGRRRRVQGTEEKGYAVDPVTGKRCELTSPAPEAAAAAIKGGG